MPRPTANYGSLPHLAVYVLVALLILAAAGGAAMLILRTVA